MPKKIVLKGVVIVRDGKRITPPIGKAFDFSASEIKDIEAAETDDSKIIRDPVNEISMADQVAEQEAADKAAAEVAAQTEAAKKVQSGKSKSAANSDL